MSDVSPTEITALLKEPVDERLMQSGNAMTSPRVLFIFRVEISSSNFPRFDRNPNAGNPFGKDAELQTVLHSDEYPSRLILPVIPAG